MYELGGRRGRVVEGCMYEVVSHVVSVCVHGQSSSNCYVLFWYCFGIRP